MQAIALTLPTLAVSALYCFWNVCRLAERQRDRRLRERVAYMLWVMATEVD
jgi:hypothetical protein